MAGSGWSDDDVASAEEHTLGATKKRGENVAKSKTIAHLPHIGPDVGRIYEG